MADNVTFQTTVATPASGTVVATDDAGAAGHVQRVKLAVSADGSATAVTADADGLLVNLGANNDVTVTGNVAVTNAGLTELAAAIDTELQVDIVGPLPAGTNAIGKLAANSGVDIGDVDVTSLPALPAGNNNIGDVDIASSVTLTTKQAAGTATLTNVNDTNVSTTLLASNASRLGAAIHNDSTAILYVKFGTTASTTSYTVKMIADAYYEVPFGYTGRIDGIWASDASGAARITELT